MKKLRSIIRYECITSFPYIWYFYGIQGMIMPFIYSVMVMIETILGNLLHSLLDRYDSFYGIIYGYENIFLTGHGWYYFILLSV